MRVEYKLVVSINEKEVADQLGTDMSDVEGEVAYQINQAVETLELGGLSVKLLTLTKPRKPKKK